MLYGYMVLRCDGTPLPRLREDHHDTSHKKSVNQRVSATEATAYAHRKITDSSPSPASNIWIMEAASHQKFSEITKEIAM